MILEDGRNEIKGMNFNTWKRGVVFFRTDYLFTDQKKDRLFICLFIHKLNCSYVVIYNMEIFVFSDSLQHFNYKSGINIYH